MPELLGIGFGVNALSGAYNMLQSIPQGFINQFFYKKNLDYQVGKQKELMDYANEYNSPSSQMERLAAAGLNPNLVYGSQAPSGVSAQGSASAPGYDQYNTSDVASAALHMAQMKQTQAQNEDLVASARLKNAEAANKEMLNIRYPELLQLQVEQASEDLRKTSAEINVAESSVNYNIARTKLTEAEELFKRNEIGLQEFQRQQIIAQTNLFVAERKLKEAQTSFVRSQDYQLAIQTQIDMLELKFKEYFFGDEGNIKEMAESERNSLVNKWNLEAEQAAAVLGIESSKAAQWSNWLASLLGRILGGSGAAAGGAGSLIKAFKK